MRTTYILETSKVNNNKVDGNIKLGLGLGNGNSGNIEIGGVKEITPQQKKETIEFSVTRSNLDDKLGEAIMYFYDPIIIRVSGDQYDMKTYGTGIVIFGITAK